MSLFVGWSFLESCLSNGIVFLSRLWSDGSLLFRQWVWRIPMGWSSGDFRLKGFVRVLSGLEECAIWVRGCQGFFAARCMRRTVRRRMRNFVAEKIMLGSFFSNRIHGWKCVFEFVWLWANSRIGFLLVIVSCIHLDDCWELLLVESLVAVVRSGLLALVIF